MTLLILGTLIFMPVPVTAESNQAGEAGEIVEIQTKILKFFATGTLDVEWQVVTAFDQIRLKKTTKPKLDFPITLFLSPAQANAVDTGRPTTLGGRPRTYAFFLGKGLASTTYGMLAQMFSEVEIEVTDSVPPRGLALRVGLSDFQFGYPGFMAISFESSMTLHTEMYMDGVRVGGESYRLLNYRGPHTFQIVNSKNTEINMIHIIAELVYQAQDDLFELAQKYYIPPPQPDMIHLDMFKVISAGRGWEFYAQERATMTEDERSLARYIISLNRAYEEKNPDFQAQTLAELRHYVKTHNLAPSSREALMDELRIWHSLRETQQAGINRADDNFYNFFGNQTDLVISVAELIPDVAKIGVLALGCTNPVTCPLLVAQMSSFEGLEIAAKVVGASSSDYMFGSGTVGGAAFAGTKAFILDRGASFAGKYVTGKMAHRLSSATATRASARLADAGYSEQFSRQVAGQMYVNRMERIIESSPAEAVSTFVSGKITNFAASTTESGINRIRQIGGSAIPGKADNPVGPLRKID